ncbi:hypothetical protein ABZ921_33625 [Streptomyces atriruber]|uniref:Sensor domain-containing protein n=1 Tax=Streptomyces atriruber TaxID=545121 RepID=A0ABV3BXU8_9ACTN
MRRSTVIALLCLSVSSLVGCSQADTSPASPAPLPLSAAALTQRLLDVSDLGEGYERAPQRDAAHDDVAVIACPAVERLGGGTDLGSSSAFAHKAPVSFTYTGAGASSQIEEELYSGRAAELSRGVEKTFDAMVSCPRYQVVSDGSVVDVSAQKVAAPDLGDEQWSQLLTYEVGGRRTLLKQTAVRTGTVMVIVSGSLGLVDAHLTAAVDKARRAG